MNNYGASFEIPPRERFRAVTQLLGGASLGLILDESSSSQVEGFVQRLRGVTIDSFFDMEGYKALLEKTDYWHGTGRYFTARDGELVDVLEGILSDGYIKAFPDSTDHRSEPQAIVAASPNRMHSRVYADTHASNLEKHERYGSSSFWLGVFAGQIVREMIADKSFGGFALYTIQNAMKSGKIRQPRTQQESVMFAEGLLRGSKIPGNFPILIGFETCEAPSKKHALEARFSEVSVSQFTHLQVPRDNIAQVNGILANYKLDIPTLPIEDAEGYASMISFSQLLTKSTSV